MKRNTITIIELIIILCVIVVTVRMWAPHKETGVQTLHNISRPTVNNISRPTVNISYSNTPCPQCGSNKLIPIDYSEKPYGLGKGLKEKMCVNCNWFSFKCPQCGSDVLRGPRQCAFSPGALNYIWVGCKKKCGWSSTLDGLLEEGYYQTPSKCQ